MATAYSIVRHNALYNLPALLTLLVVVFGCAFFLLTAVIVKYANSRNVTISWTSVVDYAAVVRISLRTASLSLRSAFEQISAAFPQRRRHVEPYELPWWSHIPTSPSASPTNLPDWSPELPPSYSLDGDATGSGDHTDGHPNSPNDPAGSTSSVSSKETLPGTVDTSSALGSDTMPWASFVAPWDLIAATTTPRASSDLEAATGHTEGHSSVDVTEA